MFLRFVALLLTASLVACASAPPTLPQGSMVSVVSLLGNTLKLRQVGITVFGNSARALDVTPWNVDTHVEDVAAAALNAAGRKATKAPAGSAISIGTWSYTNFTSSYTFAGGVAGLRKVALASHADYLILITEMPDNFSDPFFRTNQSITGFGVYQRRGGGGIAYADFGLLLVDGKSGDVIYRRRAFHSKARPDDIWLDLENRQPQVSTLGQTSADFFEVIDTAVKSGLGYLGMLPRS